MVFGFHEGYKKGLVIAQLLIIHMRFNKMLCVFINILKFVEIFFSIYLYMSICPHCTCLCAHILVHTCWNKKLVIHTYVLKVILVLLKTCRNNELNKSMYLIQILFSDCLKGSLVKYSRIVTSRCFEREKERTKHPWFL